MWEGDASGPISMFGVARYGRICRKTDEDGSPISLKEVKLSFGIDSTKVWAGMSLLEQG